MNKQIFYYAVLLLFPVMVQAQTGVGIGTINPHASAQLDVSSTTQGFLPPRMTQKQRDAISNPADGLMIYCTDCNPRGYWNYDMQVPGWVSLGGAILPDATFTSATLSCAGALNGTYQQGIALNAGNTKVLTVTANTGGKYTATTNTANGISFSVSGTLLSTGANTPITLAGTGVPVAAGTFTYTATLAGQTCSFNITFASVATFNCAGATQTLTAGGSPAGGLQNGTAYSGSFNIPYTAGNGSSYTSVNATAVGLAYGLTLTRTAGTYNAGSGTIQYVLSGTYTGTGGTVTFATAEGCTVLYGDAIRGSLDAGGCASCASYDAAAAGTWVKITQNEYNALASTSNLAGVSKTMASDAAMNTSPVSGSSLNYTWCSYGANVNTIPPSSYIVALRCPIYTVSGGNIQPKIQTSNSNLTGPFVDYGTVISNITNGSGTIQEMYWVIKRPTNTTNSGGNSYLAIYQNAANPFIGYNFTGSVYAGAGNTGNLSPSVSALVMYQTLSTPTKSW